MFFNNLQTKALRYNVITTTTQICLVVRPRISTSISLWTILPRHDGARASAQACHTILISTALFTSFEDLTKGGIRNSSAHFRPIRSLLPCRSEHFQIRKAMSSLVDHRAPILTSVQWFSWHSRSISFVPQTDDCDFLRNFWHSDRGQ